MKKLSESKPLLDSCTSEPSKSLHIHLWKCVPRIFFTWLTPLLEQGVQSGFQLDNLRDFHDRNKAQNIAIKFNHEWLHECSLRPDKPRLWLVLFRAFGRPFVIAGLAKIIHDTLQLAIPVLLGVVVASFNSPAPPSLNLPLLLILAGFIQTICLRQYFLYCHDTGLCLRSAIWTAAHAKIPPEDAQTFVNIHAQRLYDLPPYVHAAWYAIFQVCRNSSHISEHGHTMLLLYRFYWRQFYCTYNSGRTPSWLSFYSVLSFLTWLNCFHLEFSYSTVYISRPN